jgi:hypothetical protein
MSSNFRVHRCGTDGNTGCGCNEWIEESEARARINKGTAQEMEFKKANGATAVHDRAIAVVTQRFPKRPITSIELEHIERANESERQNYDRRRIEEYGELNQKIIAEAGLLGSFSAEAIEIKDGKVIRCELPLVKREPISRTVHVMPPQPEEGMIARPKPVAK